MPAVLSDVISVLGDLETRQFEAIKNSFKLTLEWKRYLRGSVQCYAVDLSSASVPGSLPVIVAVGVNYTQDGRTSEDIFQYDRGGIGVARSTASMEGVRYVLAAYERNRDAWISEEAKDSPSPLGCYGASDALRNLGTSAGESPFILIMTNVCPFVTMKQWRMQPPPISERLLEISNQYAIIDHLYDTLGSAVDLWIGHSAVSGTRWVWPTFSSFVQRRNIAEWLLTFNISPMSRLWFDGAFRDPSNPRFRWYGPQKVANSPT